MMSFRYQERAGLSQERTNRLHNGAASSRRSFKSGARSDRGKEMDGKRTVLFIDDAALLRKTLCDLLQADGFQVCGCRDGAAALDAAEKGDFHFIITDYRMPNMNGADVTRCLRSRYPASVIIGVSWEDMQKDFLAAGADAFLQKPFEYDELVKLMNKGCQTFSRHSISSDT